MVSVGPSGARCTETPPRPAATVVPSDRRRRIVLLARPEVPQHYGYVHAGATHRHRGQCGRRRGADAVRGATWRRSAPFSGVWPRERCARKQVANGQQPKSAQRLLSVRHDGPAPSGRGDHRLEEHSVQCGDAVEANHGLVCRWPPPPPTRRTQSRPLPRFHQHRRHPHLLPQGLRGTCKCPPTGMEHRRPVGWPPDCRPACASPAAPPRWQGLGDVSPIMPGSRRLAPRLAALSSLADAPYRLPPPPCDARHLTPLPDPAWSTRHPLGRTGRSRAGDAGATVRGRAGGG
ncbi:hypothetical protein SUDANB105_07531 [Streptomyces sp. enrichment culture]